MKISSSHWAIQFIYDCFNNRPKTVIGFYVAFFLAMIVSIIRLPIILAPSAFKQINLVLRYCILISISVFFSAIFGIIEEELFGSVYANSFIAILTAYAGNIVAVLFIRYVIYEFFYLVKKINIRKIEYIEDSIYIKNPRLNNVKDLCYQGYGPNWDTDLDNQRYYKIYDPSNIEVDWLKGLVEPETVLTDEIFDEACKTKRK